MTLELRNGVSVKTLIDNVVHMDHVEYSIEDFLDAAYYVLTNTDLATDDPRFGFVKVVRNMIVVPSHGTEELLKGTPGNSGRKRLDYKSRWSLNPPIWKEIR